MKWPGPAIVALACLLGGPGMAEIRPPIAGPAASPPAVDKTRPPERPPEPLQGPPAQEPRKSGLAPQREAGMSDDSAGVLVMQGPPAPPAWYLAREGDQEFAACRLALAMLGTVYRTQPVLTDPEDPDCGIARPILVQQILPDLTLEGSAVMRCETARALALWARDFARPSAATLPGAPRLTGLRLGSTYACRARIGTGAARPKLSQHALGNAIDIAAFLFDGSQPLIVEPRKDSGDQAEAFQRAVRATACLFFTTVLGPGANAAHADHLHLDVAARRASWRLCQ